MFIYFIFLILNIMNIISDHLIFNIFTCRILNAQMITSATKRRRVTHTPNPARNASSEVKSADVVATAATRTCIVSGENVSILWKPTASRITCVLIIETALPVTAVHGTMVSVYVVHLYKKGNLVTCQRVDTHSQLHTNAHVLKVFTVNQFSKFVKLINCKFRNDCQLLNKNILFRTFLFYIY